MAELRCLNDAMLRRSGGERSAIVSVVPASDVYCRVDGVNLFHHHRVRSVFVAMKRRGRVYTLYAVLLSVFWFGLPTLAPA